MYNETNDLSKCINTAVKCNEFEFYGKVQVLSILIYIPDSITLNNEKKSSIY